MLTYKCRYCEYTYSEADGAWDSAVDTGKCPKCSEPLNDFPVPVKRERQKSGYTLPQSSSHDNGLNTQIGSANYATRFCSQCGSVVGAADKFCSKCGQPVKIGTAPYPWKTVLVWIITIFVAGFIGVRPPEDIYGNTAIAYKMVFALIYSVIIGLIVGVYKYFRR